MNRITTILMEKEFLIIHVYIKCKRPTQATVNIKIHSYKKTSLTNVIYIFEFSEKIPFNKKQKNPLLLPPPQHVENPCTFGYK